VFFCLYLSISIVLFCFISYFAIILDRVHLRRRATSAPDTDSASLLLLIFFCFVATLCVNKDVYKESITR